MTSRGNATGPDLSVVFFPNITCKAQFCGFLENVNKSMNFNPRSASKFNFSNFHVHTPPREIKKKRMRYTNRKRENGKLKFVYVGGGGRLLDMGRLIEKSCPIPTRYGYHVEQQQNILTNLKVAFRLLVL